MTPILSRSILMSNFSGGTLQLAHLVFDPLVRWRKDFSLEPRLAERWVQIAPNIMRFYLRRGVTFQSGNSFAAKDIVWTFNRLRQSPDFKGLFAPFEEARAVGVHTVDIVTRGPYPLVLNLATYIFAMDSKFYTGLDVRGRDKGELIKHGASFASMNASGTGPFIVTAREQGLRVQFKRFADYWERASPGNVTSIEFTPIKEGPTRVAALLSGDVDFIAPIPPSGFATAESPQWRVAHHNARRARHHLTTQSRPRAPIPRQTGPPGDCSRHQQ